LVIPATTLGNGHGYVALTGGTSGGTEPKWPMQALATVQDGGVRWQETFGYYAIEIISTDRAKSSRTFLGALCKEIR
jgi:hypothetical protein